MRIPRLLLAAGLVTPLVMAASPAILAQPYEAKLYSEMRWRAIGPLRGGRTKAVVGVPNQPGVVYIGVCNGGVWKTNDYGRTWAPIFDDQPTGSIGDIAVAPSDPNTIYVVSGEGLQRPDLSVGNGVYKSTDAGRTWTHLGLRDGQQIPRVIVDPRDRRTLLVAVLGHAYGPNEERGVFRSTDGGETFQKVLYKDENTGASDLEFDPSNPDVVYATLWESRQGPWENAAWSGTGGGIFKSTDGGKTWRQLTGGGLPSGADGVVQADLAIAPSDPRRVYATIATPRGTGIWRSDDAGESWTRITTDTRPAGRIGGGDLPVLTVHPKNPDILFSASVVMWKSTDGGRTWMGLRGAPGGDDYQRVWIDPNNPDVMATASDQGAVVSVNGGQTWSSWYSQPTAQLYHVAADNAFPYRVCSGQQESGSACVASRGNYGQVTVREWTPVGVDEYGYAAPDPLNPDIVYGGRGPTRFDRRTGQVQSIAPTPIRRADFRVLRTAPVVFSPVDARMMYYAANTLWMTTSGGRSWTEISPDLSRKTWDVPATVGKYRDTEAAKPTQRGVIYTVAPSYVDVNTIWAGTDDGLIHVTRDGGKTWAHITNGIPDGGPINAVREDPKRKGLLFAGSEQTVYVSFDDGDHWQSLRLNLPASSIRDLIVKDDDLVVATHGRGFWILDDVTPLRQIDQKVAAADAFLFKPQTAYRVRWNMNTDTPWPPDEPAGQNPPDGAVINYWLKSAPSGPVTLEILDSAGKLVRTHSSADPIEPIDPNLAVPQYWPRPPQALSAAAGMHRFVWDLHYPPAPGSRPSYPIAAVVQNTTPSPTSPWVMAGTYTVRLTVGGQSQTQTLAVKMDPRVKTLTADLEQQFALSKQMYDGVVDAQTALQQLRAVRAQVKERQGRAQGAAVEALAAFDKQAAALEGGGGGGFGPGGPGGGGATDTLSGISGACSQLMNLLQGADEPRTTQAAAAVAQRAKELASVMARWTTLKTKDLAALNAVLTQAKLAEITIR